MHTARPEMPQTCPEMRKTVHDTDFVTAAEFNSDCDERLRSKITRNFATLPLGEEPHSPR
jgi:hypothetical protein